MVHLSHFQMTPGQWSLHAEVFSIGGQIEAIGDWPDGHKKQCKSKKSSAHCSATTICMSWMFFPQWNFSLIYVFPLMLMFSRVLVQVRQDKASVIAVICFFPREHDFPYSSGWARAITGVYCLTWCHRADSCPRVSKFSAWLKGP